MEVTQMPPVYAANLVANSGNTAYGVDVIIIQVTPQAGHYGILIEVGLISEMNVIRYIWDMKVITR